ncbi:MAG: hypothetical protein J0L51_05700 [Rhizobiales bacterium]|nr:hypothetical protein [Hyphomicrobiales bacterium]
MLTPLTAGRSSEAMELLIEGFPERGRGFWEKGLDRLLNWPGNRDSRYPPGFLWFDRGELAGIVLTPASARRGTGESRRAVVNVSSWYIREPFRWKAPLMLRALFQHADVTFTDLTPTPDVQKMLPAFGFSPASEGIEWIGTPLEAFGSSAGRLRRWRSGDPLASGSPPDELIALHVEWGCTALVLERGGESFLVITKPMRIRGLPGARVLFAGSRNALEAGLPALSRYLLVRGFLVLRVDARPKARRGRGFRPDGIWFARGDAFEDRTDHFGSELALFDF